MSISHLVEETTVSHSTISRILNEKKEYKPSNSTLRVLCDFFKIPYHFLENGILTCKKCFEDVNFNLRSQQENYRCPNCNSKLYYFIPVVTLENNNNKIPDFQVDEIRDIIKNYKLLYSSIKVLVNKIDTENLDNLSYEELVDYKNKLNLKQDVYEKINELIKRHNDRIEYDT